MILFFGYVILKIVRCREPTEREFSIVNSVWIWYFVRVSVFWPRRSRGLKTKSNHFIFWLRGCLVNSDMQGTNIMRIYKCLTY
jgi:hypothetical protein